MILILYLSFLYKTLGGGSWEGISSSVTQEAENSTCGIEECSISDDFKDIDVADTDISDKEIGIGNIINQEETVEAISEQFSLAWISLKHVSWKFFN